MTISGTLTTAIPKPVELQRAYQPSQSAAAQTQKNSLTRRFDSVTISGDNSRMFAMEARSQLVNEVRTNSAGSLSAIRDEIRQGAYRPDSMEIARKMLLFGEGG